jgi:hypothetical protein
MSGDGARGRPDFRLGDLVRHGAEPPPASFLPSESNEIQENPKKSKEIGRESNEKKLGFVWISLDSFVRFGAFQWVSRQNSKKCFSSLSSVGGGSVASSMAITLPHGLEPCANRTYPLPALPSSPSAAARCLLLQALAIPINRTLGYNYGVQAALRSNLDSISNRYHREV